LTKEIKKRKPVDEYMKLQGRFRHLSKDAIAEIQKLVDEEYERLLYKVKVTNG
jgi:pyruvate ferredoxin oxidoreductase beta subunit